MLEILALLPILVCQSLCEQPPLISDSSDQTIIASEATQVGTVIGTVSATDPDNDYIMIRFPVYETESKSLIVINQTTNEPGQASAELILNTKLDRDYAFARVNLYLTLEDSSLNRFEVTVVIELIVTDVNDEVPVFQNLPYRVDLSEKMHDLSFTYRNIKATDPDTGPGGLISYYMEPNTQSTSDAKKFRQTFRMDEATGDVTLLNFVDFEKISYFQFTILAVDGGGLNSSNELIIRILDVQDTAPQIQGTPYVITIPENIAIGHHFFTIRALDGDRGVPNEVQFSFSSGSCLTLFDIHERTGEVTIASEIDRDSGVILAYGGVCELTVLVTEVQTNFPQFGVTIATTLLTVFIRDLNDNPPEFSQDVYFAYLEDTAQLNHPLKFENKTRITVIDRDQASNGVMEIMLRGKDGALTYNFEPIPNVIASDGVPIIKLKSPDILYSGSDSFTFTILAIERDTPEKYTSSATLSISLIQVRTTTPTTTTLRTTTTPRYKDPFVPSLLGALFAVILLVWASVFTALYCYKRHLFNNNKVAPEEFTHPPPERIKMSPIKSNGNHISNGVHLPRVVDTNA